MSQRKTISLRPAFTLIEILVVVAIIALLISILLPALTRARDQAKTLRCLANLKQVGNAMAYYINDTQSTYLPPFRYPIEHQGLKDSSGKYQHPYWFQYLPFKYLANEYHIAACPSDSKASKYGRTGYRSMRGGNDLTWSYAMNDRLPIPDPTKYPPYSGLGALGLLQDYVERYQATSIKQVKRPVQTIYLLETIQHNLMSGDSSSRQFRVDHGGRKERVNLLFADTHAEGRNFDTIWHGDRVTGVSDLANPATCPARFRQLWYGDPNAKSQLYY